jgi:uroporphyrinogen III methyltransferase/synthase
LLLPVVEIRDPADWGPVDRALRQLAAFVWLVFTSGNGVHAFMRRLRSLGLDMRSLGHLKLAAIGPATAAALRSYQLDADLVPGEFRSEALAQALSAHVAGKRVLLARADRGRELLYQELARMASVEQVAVYSQVDAAADCANVLQGLRQGQVDWVTLTSSNIARAFVRSLDSEMLQHVREGKPRLASISPVTSAAIRELGLPIAAEAAEYTSAGLIEAILQMVRRG